MVGSGLARSLRASLSCQVLAPDDPGVARYTSNFSQRHRATPDAVVLAAGPGDLAAALAAARALDAPVSLRGSGHGGGRLGLSAGGILLVSRTAAPGLRWLPGHRVEVSASALWVDVEHALNAAGRTVPVLTSELSTTVGGTLSVGGGFGLRSIREGSQVDSVEALRLLLPDGGSLDCPPTSDLARGCLAGLGQLGVLERVTLRTAERRPMMRIATREHPDLLSLLDDLSPWLSRVEPWCDELSAIMTGGLSWRSFVSTAHLDLAEAQAPAPEPLASWGGAIHVERRELPSDEPRREPLDPGRDAHLWGDYLLDLEGMKQLAREIEPRLRASALLRRHLGYGLLLGVAPGDPQRRPHLDPRAWGATAAGLGLGFYFDVPADDLATIGAAEDFHELCLARCCALGGRPYQYGTHVMPPSLLRSVYGASMERHQALRDAHDPARLLNRHLLLG